MATPVFCLHSRATSWASQHASIWRALTPESTHYNQSAVCYARSCTAVWCKIVTRVGSSWTPYQRPRESKSSEECRKRRQRAPLTLYWWRNKSPSPAGLTGRHKDYMCNLAAPPLIVHDSPYNVNNTKHNRRSTMKAISRQMLSLWRASKRRYCYHNFVCPSVYPSITLVCTRINGLLYRDIIFTAQCVDAWKLSV